MEQQKTISNTPNPWQIAPEPKRDIKPVTPAPTIASVLAAVDELKTRTANAVSEFESEKQSTAKWDRLRDISARLDVLMPEVQRLQAEADAIKNAPSPEQAFLKSVEQLEHECRMRAGDALGILLEAKAVQVFETPYRELSNETREDIAKPFKTLRQLVSNAQASFALTKNKTVASALATLNRIATNLRTIADFTAEKAAQYKI